MLDLSKSYGTYKGVVFYGDHENEKLIYYLPNQIRLSRILDAPNEQLSYELQLQIFHEGQAVEGGLGELEKSSGSILSIGIECVVEEERLEDAKEDLLDALALDEEEDIIFATPSWKEGKVDLLVLDATTQNEDTLGGESFVEAINGSKVPSLLGGDLKTVFNVRLDRKGTAIVASSLEGERSHIAGVLYDLKFEGIRPALDLRIKANLSRAKEKAGHYLSLNVGYPPYVGVGAGYENIKTQLEEDGVIQVEVLSQVTDSEMRKLIRETVEEFKDKVMEQLFQPIIMPQDAVAALLGQMTQSAQGGNIVQLGYKFKEEEEFHDRELEIDYRERSALEITHNPQSHLWVFGEQIGYNLSDYVKTTTFDSLWLQNTLKISILHDFENSEHDLLSAEVLIWKREVGYTYENEGFAIPEGVESLASFTFTKDEKVPHEISWITKKGEAVGFFYQVKFLFDPNHPLTHTPTEVYSKVEWSASEDLIVIPHVLAPLYYIDVKTGFLNYELLNGVEVKLSCRDMDSTEILDTKLIRFNPDHVEDLWRVRRPLQERLYFEEVREFHFKEFGPTLKMGPFTLLDEEFIINDPFAYKLNLIPVFVGATAEMAREVLLSVSYEVHGMNYRDKQLFRAQAPSFLLDEITIRVLDKEDVVHWEASAITPTGELEFIKSGQSQGGALLIDMKSINLRTLTVKWGGVSPEMEDLKYVRLEFRIVSENGIQELDRVDFSGDQIPSPVKIDFPKEGELQMRLTKKYMNGEKEKGDFEPLLEEEILIKP